MSDTTTDTLNDLARDARELASALYRGPECTQADPRRGNSLSCIQREEVRPLRTQEERFGWSRRPFYAYSAEAMCACCRAYFFAELAAQELEQLAALGRKYGSGSNRSLPQKG